MDQAEIHIKRNIEAAREAMNEKIALLEHRIHKAVIVPKRTIVAAIENIDEIKASMEATKSTIDCGLETMTQSVEETIVKVKSIAEHFSQMGHNPWMLLAGAILMGYAVGSLNRGQVVVRRQTSTEPEGNY